MDEMPIKCQCEPDHVDFKSVGCKNWTTFFAQLPAKIHETDLLHASSNVPLPQNFLSKWTQQTMFDG
jgi:hypothetical protein